MRKLLLIGCLVLISACSKDEPRPEDQGPTAASPRQSTSPPATIVNQPSFTIPKPNRDAPYKTALNIPAQPEPVYQSAQVPARPAKPVPKAVPGSAQLPATAPVSAQPKGPDTASLFGVGSSATPSPASVPVQPQITQQRTAQAMASLRQRPLQQAMPFEECSRRLQGVVARNANIKVVQNDASGYAVEMSTPEGAQRISCARQENTAAISVR